MPFDTLKIAKQMEAAGMPRPQCEALANVLQDEYYGQLVTSTDLGAAVDRLEATIEASEQRLNSKIEAVEIKLEAAKSELNNKIDGTKVELNNKIDLAVSDLGGRINALDARMTMMQWMMGLVIALCLGILWKLMR